jgi:hypothetical protein
MSSQFTINKTQLIKLIRESIQGLNEEKEIKEVDDFFNMLEVDPPINSFAFVYYLSPLDSGKMNKSYINSDGVKELNPMYGKIYKNSVFQFNYGKTYSSKVLKLNPDYQFSEPKGKSEKVDGYTVLRIGNDGKLMLPIADPKIKHVSYIYYGGKIDREISEDELKIYLPKRNISVSSSGVDYRNLNVDRIYKLSAGKHVWLNPHFQYKELKNELK